jgi:hypothetical protein
MMRDRLRALGEAESDGEARAKAPPMLPGIEADHRQE